MALRDRDWGPFPLRPPASLPLPDPSPGLLIPLPSVRASTICLSLSRSVFLLTLHSSLRMWGMEPPHLRFRCVRTLSSLSPPWGPAPPVPHLSLHLLSSCVTEGLMGGSGQDSWLACRAPSPGKTPVLCVILYLDPTNVHRTPTAGPAWTPPSMVSRSFLVHIGGGYRVVPQPGSR